MREKKQPKVFLLLPERLNESDYMPSSSLRKSRGKHKKTSLDETVRTINVERIHKKKKSSQIFKTEKLKRFKHFSARRWGLHQISHDPFQLYTLIYGEK